jgi:cardiolipin synthase
MDFTNFLTPITWNAALALVIGAYALIVAFFLILENRSPQSTIAWLFLLIVLPLAGVVLYLMFGRGRHAFSRGRTLARLLEGTTLERRSAAVMERQPAALAALERSHGDCARLAAMLWTSARAPLAEGNRLEILQDAREKYPRLLEDIRAARSSIHMLYYEWASDGFTEELGALLARRVADGVTVRIMYDPVGSFWMLSRSYVRRLQRAGISMIPFSPVYQLHTLSYRNHRKIAVIDGCIGYSGGLNMTEKHLTGPDGFTGWRDTHARIVGGAVAILQSVFATMWHNTTGENLFAERHFPAPVVHPDGVPVQVVSAGPDSRWEAIRHSYLAMIALAREHVYVQSPFLILDTSVGEALKTAALAGLDVRVMIAPAGAELSPAYRASLTYAADMARAGVQVLLYQGAYFHSKTVCVDSALCSIGSANMDIRSFSINYETNLVVYDEGVTRALEADFQADEARSVPFSVSEYESRHAGSRFVDSTLRLCSPLL